MPSYFAYDPWVEPSGVPVRCDYCSCVEMHAGRDKVSNCRSCGGPLPIPEVREVVVEREYRITRTPIEVTSFSDTNRVYIEGMRDERVRETAIRSERIKGRE